MAKQKFRAFKQCFHYNKRFKQGDYFPQEWLAAGYTPNEYFCTEEDYEDMVTQSTQNRWIESHGDDPRPTAQLIQELEVYIGDVPRNWHRKQIWAELRRRELAESKTEPGKRKAGRPAKEDST